MSSGLLNALKKVGLVQVTDEEVAMPEAAPAPAPIADSEATATAGEPAAPIVEQRPLERLYADEGVPPCVYPAEKLLKVLAGLRAMDASTRRAAVGAMDEADDAWAIEDVLLDADRKIKVLEAHKQRLATQARACMAEADERVRERDRQQQEAVASVRQQIAELQALMEREVEKASADKAAAQSAGRAAQDACARESARLDEEIGRLREIPDTFGNSGV